MLWITCCGRIGSLIWRSDLLPSILGITRMSGEFSRELLFHDFLQGQHDNHLSALTEKCVDLHQRIVGEVKRRLSASSVTPWWKFPPSRNFSGPPGRSGPEGRSRPPLITAK